MARVVYLSLSVALMATLWALTTTRTRDTDEESTLPVPSGPDPEPLVDVSLLDQAAWRPVHVDGAKEVVLLVHGTGVTPEINWDYTLVPPLVRQGFQPCYVAVPYRLLLDIQTSAEYISHAIKKFAKEYQSPDGMISIISWSAGSLATQWTLTFYPETRSKVRRHIALGPSYRGSWMMAPLFYLNRYSEAVVQQLPWSNLLATLRRFSGLRAHVPTTNIGSSTDQVVQPSFFGEAKGGHHRDAWRLGGPLASNVDIFKTCLSTALAQRRLPRFFTHESLLWEPASHAVIFDALTNDETRVGTAEAIGPGDYDSKLAPGLEPAWREKHRDILPELLRYAPTLPRSGWPEVSLRNYTRT
ncbi:putative lipase [Xylariaceae sp. FL0662B]|nr:putative lipase [Xylariaceae sp. FL0662B]